MTREWYEQLAKDVENGHLTEQEADRIEREYDDAEYLASCQQEAESALPDD